MPRSQARSRPMNMRSPPEGRRAKLWPKAARIPTLQTPSADVAARTAADPADLREQVARRERGEHGQPSVVAPKQVVNSGAQAPPALVTTETGGANPARAPY